MAYPCSLRRMWVIYKKILIADGDVARRDLILAQTRSRRRSRAITRRVSHLINTRTRFRNSLRRLARR